MKPIRQILEDARTIAVVGLSPQPARASLGVATYLQAHGYRIVPVNPNYAGRQILGEKVYPDLRAAALWMQLGIQNQAAADMAAAAGLDVVMNHCMKIEHSRMMRVAGQS